MSAFASVISPYSYSAAIELGNHRWQKKILPVGDLEYQGRQLHFTPSYIRGLADAFHQRAYDQVSFQLADAANTHTNDPERHRGTIVDMKAQPDGLYVILEPTERGERILTENPYLGVSARIVEQFQRGDGAFFPAAVQHVLGTLDPRIPGLGAWEPVSLSGGGDPALTIDLSNLSFAGEPAPVLAPAATLNDAELADLLQAVAEVDAEAAHRGYQPGADAFSEFDAAFTARAQAEQDRQDAISAAILEDTLHPATRMEDKLARAMSRAAAGVYDGQQMAFASEQSAVELAMATGHAPCGVPDEWGRCSARYHSLLGCSHNQNVDWLAIKDGPPRSTYQASLSNFAESIEMSAPMSVGYGDDDDEPCLIPSTTVQLAHELAVDWGLFGDAPAGTPTFDPLRAPSMPVSMYDTLHDQVTFADSLPQPQAGYPGIAEIRERMGI